MITKRTLYWVSIKVLFCNLRFIPPIILLLTMIKIRALNFFFQILSSHYYKAILLIAIFISIFYLYYFSEFYPPRHLSLRDFLCSNPASIALYM